MNKNDYSKYKYENTLNLNFSVDADTQHASILNAELRTIKPNLNLDVLGHGVHLNVGQTILTNNIYECTQVTYVDKPVVINAIKRVFFNFFNF